MPELFEILMIVSFGISWPINLIKAVKSRTAKGTSLGFLILIFMGYVCGIASKFINPAYMASFSEKWYVLIFYFINLIVVGLNITVYFRNRALDRTKEN